MEATESISTLQIIDKQTILKVITIPATVWSMLLYHHMGSSTIASSITIPVMVSYIPIHLVLASSTIAKCITMELTGYITLRE